MTCVLPPLGQPAQHLQELAVVGRDPPRLYLGLGAGRHGRYALAQVVDVGDGPAVQADDDVAEAQSRLGGRTAGHGTEQEGAVGIGQAEREGQRQLEGLHLHAEPALLDIVGLAAELDLQPEQAPLRLRRFARPVWDRRGLLRGRDRDRLSAARQSLRHAHDIDAAIGHELEEGADGRRVRARQWRSRLRRRCAGPCDSDGDRNLQSEGASRTPAHVQPMPSL